VKNAQKKELMTQCKDLWEQPIDLIQLVWEKPVKLPVVILLQVDCGLASRCWP